MTLYFNPTSKVGNGLGVFDAFQESVDDPGKKDLVLYLINWVAGTKLIFIMLGIVVVVFGNLATQFYAVVALILSILSFYWRLFPIIKKLDKEGKISPKGYSKTLNLMIIGFLTMFILVLAIKLATGGFLA